VELTLPVKIPASLKRYNRTLDMSYQVLARKYRPQRFSDVIGQDHVTRTLKNAIEQQRIAHGYIFSGHRGIGKTTIARILAMALNCRGVDGKADKPTPEPCGVCDSCTEIRAGSAVDVIEIDAATNRGIDEIRELRDAARYRPARDRFKIYILDEAHQITDAAFNALLKTLEEPPSHIVFMMATTQAEDIPQTIRSRCQHFSFHAVKFDEIVKQLGDIAGKENIQADDEALAVLAEAGDGSMRDALSIMDQAIACCGTTLSGELVRGLAGTVGSEIMEELMATVERSSSQDALRILDRLMTEGQNPAHFARQFVRFLRNTVVAKVAGNDSALLQISSDERARVARVAQQFSEEDLARFLQIMLRTFDELGYRQEQRFHLELGVLKLVHAQRILPLEQMLSQVAADTPKATPSARPAPVLSSSAPASTPFAAPAKKQETFTSPFEADRARKGRGFDPEMSESAPQIESSSPTSSSPSAATSPTSTLTSGSTVGVAVALEDGEPGPDDSVQRSQSMSEDPAEILAQVVAVIEDVDTNLSAVLESGTATIQGNELIVAIDKPASIVPFIMNEKYRPIVNKAASDAAGRPLKLKLVGGAPARTLPANVAKPARTNGNGNGQSARSRAANDPIVRRMQEKFGAEIRTVIDKSEKD
jgi:DNA polymerase III subunit gamma/tau